MWPYVLPALAGLACGLLGGAPYAWALRAQKRSRSTSIRPALVAVCVSFAVLAASLLVGYAATDGTALVVFVWVLVAAFLAAVVVSVACYGRRPRP